MDAQTLDHAATAFAHLLATAQDDNVDAAYAQACALSEGLFPHQVEGVAFLLGRRHAILADDMGLGKTRQAIVALRHAAPDGQRLVICPASLKANWAREIRMVEPEAGIAIVPAPGALAGSARWVIVNYDVLARHAEDTLDQFVQAVLETKAALVDAVVEGKALTDGASGNILADLEHALGTLSPRLADLGQRDLDDELVRQLREAADAQRADVPPAATSTRPLDPTLLRRALLALARVLRGPEDRRFRIASSSSPGSFYTVTAGEGDDVTCTCPEFEYRGACRHARELKTMLAKGAAVPAGFTPVGD